MRPLSRHSSPSYIRRLVSVEKFDAIAELADVFRGSPMCTDVQRLVAALDERERILSTGIGFGIAIPHARLPCVTDIAFAIGLSEKGIEFDSMDGKPVRLAVMVVAGEGQHRAYLKLLSEIIGVIRDEGTRERIVRAESADEILRILDGGVPVRSPRRPRAGSTA